MPAASAWHAEKHKSEIRPNILFVIFDDWGPSAQANIAGSTWINSEHVTDVAVTIYEVARVQRQFATDLGDNLNSSKTNNASI